MILLQGRTVTLTFKVGTQILRATRRLNMVVIIVKKFKNPTSNNEVMGRTRMGRTYGRTDKAASIKSKYFRLSINRPVL